MEPVSIAEVEDKMLPLKNIYLMFCFLAIIGKVQSDFVSIREVC